MSGFAIEQIQEQMRQLKLVRTADELPLLLQDASKGEVPTASFSPICSAASWRPSRSDTQR